MTKDNTKHEKDDRPFEERFTEIAALWSKDKGIMSGKDKEGQEIVVFPNKFATPENRQPTHRLYKVNP